MSDNVNHPKHYTGFSNGAEVIDITENLTFNLGNVVKYVARAGRKTDDPIEDLQKAKFYLEREINRLVRAKQTAGAAWTLESITKLRDKLWDERTPKLARVWDDLDEVPVFVIVEDVDGDWWRWNPETLDLEIAFGGVSGGVCWELLDITDVDQSLCTPFKEVIA